MHVFPDGARWRTSSYTQQQNCVEVADAPGVTAVRDTKNREQGSLLFSSTEWRAFIDAVKRDTF
ncbi:DUF397 domain-containing protein [Thermobifida halotolerans]|uniref:DUF397 domain-containing protein n=1 Tax=Thermobifida halotolerans TaxID=483545 RepID=A0A399G3E5_9ACTN|nr:DUF397 domain-containing protein [Thermobifida halotolerans]UOE19100.1 DUF397 domain-containing protein [Thermobifida halotolerans]